MPRKWWNRLGPERSKRPGGIAPPRPSRCQRAGAVEELEPRLVLSTVPVVSMTYNVVTDTKATTSAFVVDLYADVLFRSAGPRAMRSLDKQLRSGRMTAGGAFASLVASPEFTARVAPVLSMYEAYLGRPADAQGLRSWVGRERAGSSLAQIATRIARSPEFIALNGNVLAESNRDFVGFLYQKLFDRAPDAGSLNFWSKALQSGSATRGGLLVSFLKTPEFAAAQPLVPTENIVNMAYIGLWGRNPDSSFSSAVAGFTNTTALGNSFIKGAHYLGVGAVRNYIVGLYEGLLHRQPDAQGYRHWSSLMLSLRKTDAQVYSAFVQSPAFRAANPDRHFLPNVVTRTYQTLLGRKPTREELKGGEAYLRSGHSLASFATQFLTSEEFTANAYAQNVQHTVVVYQENWSFDGLFGLFPGVNAIADASPVSEQQVMQDGTPYQSLPPSNDANVSLPSLPFDLAPYQPPSEITGDPAHAFYQEQAQINGGLMNKFVAWGYYTGSTEYNGTNDVMSYYDSRTLPLGPLAEGYTIDDDFFHSGFGGSFFNGIFLVAAAPPFFSGPIPTDLIAVLNSNGTLKQDANGAIVNDGIVTPSGYAVNDIEAAGFHDPNDPGPYLPTLNDNDPSAPHYTPTIGDLLSAAGTSWKWYSQGWNQAVADIHTQAPPGFVYDHQSLTYFANYQLGTPGQVAHIQDLSNYDLDVSQGTLPKVAFLKGLDTNDEHPGVSSELAGQLWAAQQVAVLQNSSSWSNSTAIITYDENGGRWDQVAPPVEDQWGPGTRVPAIVISPFAKRGFVDNTQYETVSIDKTLEDQYHLPALSTRDAGANAMYNSYTFSPTDIVRNN